MFGKLLKNDFKSSARGVSAIYFAGLIATLAMVISLFTGFGVGKILAIVVMMATCWLVLIVTIVQMFADFRKTMFMDRGYLTNTLPVKSFSLVFSKWLVSICWILIGCIYMAVCYTLLYAYTSGENGIEAFKMVIEYLPMLGLPEMSVIGKAIPFFAIKFFCWIAANVAIVYFSVTVSNIKPFDKFGAFGIIVVFFAVFAFVNVLGNKLDDLVSFAVVVSSEAKLTLSVDRDLIKEANYSGGCYVSLTQIYFEIIAAAGLFIGTSELIEKKINVK